MSLSGLIDTFFAFLLWIIGSSLFCKMKAAASDTYDHAVSHSEYETSLPPASIARWTAEVKAWEQDPLQPNPYEFTVISM